MKLTTTVIATAFATLAAAQDPIFNPNGTFTCPVPNGSYCVGYNIILRCTNGVGQPGNCNDNLAGDPPIGVNDSPCWDKCGNTTGRAACSKNGIVYASSGAGLGNASFSENSTAICSVPVSPSSGGAAASGSPTPYANGTNPGGPVATGSSRPPGPSGSGTPVPYTGAATSVGMMGAGAVVGFGVLFAALAML